MTGTYNFTVTEGADFNVMLTWTAGSPAAPVNLTGWSAHMQIRSGPYMDSSGSIIADLSSPSDGIVLGGTAGTINLVIAAADTTGWGLGQSAAFYDLKMTNPSGNVTRLLQGSVLVSQAVTV